MSNLTFYYFFFVLNITQKITFTEINKPNFNPDKINYLFKSKARHTKYVYGVPWFLSIQLNDPYSHAT